MICVMPFYRNRDIIWYLLYLRSTRTTKGGLEGRLADRRSTNDGRLNDQVAVGRVGISITVFCCLQQHIASQYNTAAQ